MVLMYQDYYFLALFDKGQMPIPITNHGRPPKGFMFMERSSAFLGRPQWAYHFGFSHNTEH